VPTPSSNSSGTKTPALPTNCPKRARLSGDIVNPRVKATGGFCGLWRGVAGFGIGCFMFMRVPPVQDDDSDLCRALGLLTIGRCNCQNLTWTIIIFFKADGSSGNVYVAGDSYVSWGKPVNAHAGEDDAFAAKIDSDSDGVVRCGGGSDSQSTILFLQFFFPFDLYSSLLYG
jgi:hypothetical protein